MSLISQLNAASLYALPAKRNGRLWESEKKSVRNLLSRIPINRKQAITGSGLSPDKVDRALKELVATGIATIVRPGEFGRRSLYILSNSEG